MDLNLKDCLKIGATGLSGLFAGCTLYVNAAGHPAGQTLDLPNCRKDWKENFLRARKIQRPMAVLGALAGAGAYYLDKDSDTRSLWLVGSSIFICVWPWTVIVMLPDIKKNLQDDVIKTAGETWVKNHIIRWNKQHGVKTFLSCTAFGIFLYALSRK
ncbi:uncharacterized protein LOC123531604 [Mercenaria mercenaria]|uniref:uncharacterized protein LOC123531604 n=1 Tax=Mercenaria mercenaria TaxID=6596 RepID=UPI00234E4262|nr:uncharacterized protein LOC123531604 [Mercenaria mercenaria]